MSGKTHDSVQCRLCHDEWADFPFRRGDAPAKLNRLQIFFDHPYLIEARRIGEEAAEARTEENRRTRKDHGKDEPVMKMYLVSEIAAILRLSDSQIYNLIGSGRLRCHRLTTRKQGGVRVSEEQLRQYLNSTATQPAGENHIR